MALALLAGSPDLDDEANQVSGRTGARKTYVEDTGSDEHLMHVITMRVSC
jgi:hypothetical protein